MALNISRMSAKGQTVIPKNVREKLHLKNGDVVRYVIRGKDVILERANDEAQENPFVTFNEWESANDEEAFKDL